MRKATDLRCWAFVTAWQRGRLGYSLHGDDSLVGALRVADTRRDVPPLQLADLTKLVHLSHRLLHLTPSLLVHFGLGGGRRLLPSHSERRAAAAAAATTHRRYVDVRLFRSEDRAVLNALTMTTIEGQDASIVFKHSVVRNAPTFRELCSGVEQGS